MRAAWWLAVTLALVPMAHAEAQRTTPDSAQRAGSTLEESMRQADAILASTTSLRDALAQARLITEPRVRDATERRIVREYSLLHPSAAGQDASELALLRVQVTDLEGRISELERQLSLLGDLKRQVDRLQCLVDQQRQSAPIFSCH